MSTHRQQAQRKTRAWQAAAVVLLVVAGGLIALPLGRLLGPATSPDSGRPVPNGSHDTARSAVAIDIDRIAAILRNRNLTVGTPVLHVPTETAPSEEPVDEPSTAPPAAASATGWAYLGSIVSPRSKHALIRPDGARVESPQFLLAEGRAHDATTLVEVFPDYITIERDGVRSRINRQAPTLAWATEPRRGGPGAQPGRPQPLANSAAMQAADAEMARRAEQSALMERMAKAQAEAAGMAGTNNIRPWTPPDFDPAEQADMAKILAYSENEEERQGVIKQLGIPEDSTPEERMVYFRQFGVDVDNTPVGQQLKKELESSQER